MLFHGEPAPFQVLLKLEITACIETKDRKQENEDKCDEGEEV